MPLWCKTDPILAISYTGGQGQEDQVRVLFELEGAAPPFDRGTRLIVGLPVNMTARVLADTADHQWPIDVTVSPLAAMATPGQAYPVRLKALVPSSFGDHAVRLTLEGGAPDPATVVVAGRTGTALELDAWMQPR